MSKKVVVLLFSYIILIISCNTTEPPPPEKTITLSLEDTFSIEAWIKLKTTNLQLPTTITLKQNNQTRSTINLVNADTLLYIDSLLPNTTYNFQAITQSSNQSIISNELTITTMDTTSHNFTWQSWTFGEHGSSELRDVTIIDENNIWAVGRVYLNDSTGQIDSEGYGIVRWDGNSWEVIRLFWTHPQGFVWSLLPFGIYAITENNIWFVAGDVHQWDGQTLTSHPIGNFSGNPNPILEEGQYPVRIWGSNDIVYTVGLQGAIAYFDGNNWKRVDAQTDGDIFDIIAVENSDITVFCPLNFVQNPSNDKIFKITQTDRFEFLDYDKGTAYSVWTKKGFPIYVCGSVISVNKNGYWEELSFGEEYLCSRIRGNNLNDIFIVGTFGFVGHFNGMEWKQIMELAQPSNIFRSIAVKGNLVVMVGRKDLKGLIVLGRRN